jgi:K+-sensing histidine kinase KdpD
VRVNFEQLIDPYQALDMEVNGLVGLGMTIANTIFNNYGTKIDSVLQNGDHTILRIRFPVNIEAKKRLPRKKAAKK